MGRLILSPPPSSFEKKFDIYLQLVYNVAMKTSCKICGSTDMSPRSGLCKEHRKEYYKEYYQKNKTKIIAKNTVHNERNRNRNRQWLIDFLRTQQCVDCGNKDIEVLQFDHRDRELKTKMVHKFIYSSIERMKEEVDKCDIRCANCHIKRSRRQLGWWTDDMVE